MYRRQRMLVRKLATALALIEMPTKRLRAAAFDIPHGLQVAGEHSIPKLYFTIYILQFITVNKFFFYNFFFNFG